MKRLLTITGVLLTAYILLTGYAGRADAPCAQAASADAEQAYTLTGKDGLAAVYRGDELLLVTDTRLSDLPKADANRLREGITVTSEKELKRLLEDICS